MKFIIDFIPIFIFFITYKMSDIYTATMVLIASSFLLLVTHWIIYRTVDRIQLLTFIFSALLGASTLLFHEEIYIKWKPTAIYWGLALFFLGSQLIRKKNLLQYVMGNKIILPEIVWQRLSFCWVAFFIAMGITNLYVVYNFDTNTWVNFKLFGTLGLTVVFIVLQSIYMSRYIKPEN
ncbi:septation protein A [soil metagenome]